MTEKQYRDEIRKACVSLGVHRAEFTRTRCRLARIYVRIEEIDRAVAAGEIPLTVIRQTKNGEAEIISPQIQELDRLNDQALTYEKALGMTADGAKKLREDLFAPQPEENPLSRALRVIGR